MHKPQNTHNQTWHDLCYLVIYLMATAYFVYYSGCSATRAF